jgi:hypothetical protein
VHELLLLTRIWMHAPATTVLIGLLVVLVVVIRGLVLRHGAVLRRLLLSAAPTPQSVTTQPVDLLR